MTDPPLAGGVGNATELGNCEREPIRIPGSIQPHGALLVLAKDDRTVIQVSENAAAMLRRSPSELLGSSLDQLLGGQAVEQLAIELHQVPGQGRPLLLGTLAIGTAGASGEAGSRGQFHLLAHRSDGQLVLELEADDSDSADSAATIHRQRLVDAYTLQAEAAQTIPELASVTATTVRQLTGFDRVLIYRFDADWHGTVIGEAGSGRLPSYLHHRFPASDIPAQARELYRLNRLRMIPDSAYRSVPLHPPHNPATGRPLDLSFATLRSVSPVHVEYMQNMQTASSMSVSILRDGQLWGLVSCHHQQPKQVPFPVRETCDLIGRAFSLRLSGLQHSEHNRRRVEMRSVFSTLLAAMADHGNAEDALAERVDQLLRFADAPGAAIVTANGCRLLGHTPSEQQVRQLAEWLFASDGQDVYSTACLTSAYPPAEAYREQASGLLAIAISKLHPAYVMWFRPEVVQTIRWGGDPQKTVLHSDGGKRLHPRRSFETWKQTVQNQSLPWEPGEIEGAAELRNAIVGLVLRKAEELAELNTELTRSNTELEAFSYSVSHDLRAPLRHIVGYAEILKASGSERLTESEQRCITTIIESSEYAGELVDKLLNYSRLGRAELQRSRIDMNALLREIQQDVMEEAEGRHVTWQVADVPMVVADLMMLRMAVRNLLANAVKYTRVRDQPVIEVGGREEDGELRFWVKDNGVGFDMQYSDKLFGVFQRLHRYEDYEGTGIGLANVRRVIERHGGRTWAEGIEGQGATFYFTLPKP